MIRVADGKIENKNLNVDYRRISVFEPFVFEAKL